MEENEENDVDSGGEWVEVDTTRNSVRNNVPRYQRMFVEQVQNLATISDPMTLRQNGFLYRPAPPALDQLPIREDYYVREVFVWWPSKQLKDVSNGRILCSCGKGGSHFDKGSWSETIRKVIDVKRVFYLTFRRYTCDSCKKKFRNIDEEVLAMNPIEFRVNFGIITFQTYCVTTDLSTACYTPWFSSTVASTVNQLNSMHYAQFERAERLFYAHWARISRRGADGNPKPGTIEHSFTTQHRRNKEAGIIPIEAAWKTANDVYFTRLTATLVQGVGENKVNSLGQGGISFLGELAMLDLATLPCRKAQALTNSQEKSKPDRVRKSLSGWIKKAQETCCNMAKMNNFEQFKDHYNHFVETTLMNSQRRKEIEEEEECDEQEGGEDCGNQPETNSNGPSINVPIFGPYDDTEGYNGFYFSSKLIDTIVFRAFGQQEDFIKRYIASSPAQVIGLDVTYKVPKLIKTRLHDDDKVTYLQTMQGLVTISQEDNKLVHMQGINSGESFAELRPILEEFSKNQREVHNVKNWQPAAVYVDKCCTFRGEIRKIWKETHVLLDPYHWLARWDKILAQKPDHYLSSNFRSLMTAALFARDEQVFRKTLKKKGDIGKREKADLQKTFRTIPPQKALMQRVDAVLKACLDYDHSIDVRFKLGEEEALKIPRMFKKKASDGKSFNQVVANQKKHIQNNCLSDPDGVPLHAILGRRAVVARGTNACEAAHRSFRQSIPYGCCVGPVRGDMLILQSTFELNFRRDEEKEQRGRPTCPLLASSIVHRLELNSLVHQVAGENARLPYPEDRIPRLGERRFTFGLAALPLGATDEDRERWCAARNPQPVLLSPTKYAHTLLLPLANSMGSNYRLRAVLAGLDLALQNRGVPEAYPELIGKVFQGVGFDVDDPFDSLFLLNKREGSKSIGRATMEILEDSECAKFIDATDDMWNCDLFYTLLLNMIFLKSGWDVTLVLHRRTQPSTEFKVERFSRNVLGPSRFRHLEAWIGVEHNLEGSVTACYVYGSTPIIGERMSRKHGKRVRESGKVALQKKTGEEIRRPVETEEEKGLFRAMMQHCNNGKGFSVQRSAGCPMSFQNFAQEWNRRIKVERAKGIPNLYPKLSKHLEDFYKKEVQRKEELKHPLNFDGLRDNLNTPLDGRVRFQRRVEFDTLPFSNNYGSLNGYVEHLPGALNNVEIRDTTAPKFAMAPWRVLDGERGDLVLNSLNWHKVCRNCLLVSKGHGKLPATLYSKSGLKRCMAEPVDITSDIARERIAVLPLDCWISQERKLGHGEVKKEVVVISEDVSEIEEEPRPSSKRRRYTFNKAEFNEAAFEKCSSTFGSQPDIDLTLSRTITKRVERKLLEFFRGSKALDSDDAFQVSLNTSTMLCTWKDLRELLELSERRNACLLNDNVLNAMVGLIQLKYGAPNGVTAVPTDYGAIFLNSTRGEREVSRVLKNGLRLSGRSWGSTLFFPIHINMNHFTLGVLVLSEDAISFDMVDPMVRPTWNPYHKERMKFVIRTAKLFYEDQEGKPYNGRLEEPRVFVGPQCGSTLCGVYTMGYLLLFIEGHPIEQLTTASPVIRSEEECQRFAKVCLARLLRYTDFADRNGVLTNIS